MEKFNHHKALIRLGEGDSQVVRRADLRGTIIDLDSARDLAHTSFDAKLPEFDFPFCDPVLKFRKEIDLSDWGEMEDATRTSLTEEYEEILSDYLGGD
jgi:hypothetical protein